MYKLSDFEITDIRESYKNGVSPIYLYTKYGISKYKFFSVVRDLPKQSTRGYNGSRCDNKMARLNLLKE